MATVILDTDFLSSFLKIGQCDLIQNFYQADQTFIPLAVHLVNIPAFLMACKVAGLVNPEQMAKIIQDLKEKDFYEFKKDKKRGRSVIERLLF